MGDYISKKNIQNLCRTCYQAGKYNQKNIQRVCSICSQPCKENQITICGRCKCVLHNKCEEKYRGDISYCKCPICGDIETLLYYWRFRKI